MATQVSAAPTPCPPGRYIIGQAVFGTNEQAILETTLTSISLSPCGVGKGKPKAKKKFTLVKAKWPTCGDAKKVVFNGKIPAATCSSLSGKLKAKKVPAQTIAAALSSCGDAALDTATEQCDASAAGGDTACPGRCRATADAEGAACTCIAEDPVDPDDFIGGEAAGDQAATVALSADGTRVVIGAPFNDGTAASAGHARVFERTTTGWTQLGADLDGEAADDRYGAAVAISDDGNRIAVGSYLNDGSGTNSGHVRVFDYAGGAWTQVGGDIDGPAGKGAGWAVALSGNGARVIIGGPESGGVNGVVAVYEFTGAVWTFVGGSFAGGNELGHAVAISDDGNRIAMSAPSGAGANSPGYTTIYEFNGTSWDEIGDIAGEADNDGAGSALSFSADGTVLAIGGPGNFGEGTSGGGTKGGHVRVYRQVTGVWTQIGSDLDGPAGSQFGTAVALSEDGTRLLASGIGTIRWFILQNDTWTLQSTPTFVADRRAGSSVSISAAGTFGAVGAEYGDTDAGLAAGIVRVYALP